MCRNGGRNSKKLSGLSNPFFSCTLLERQVEIPAFFFEGGQKPVF